MIYEKRVTTSAGVRRELETMDGDAGMRVRGTLAGRRCLAFVTRFGKTYTVVVCEVEKGSNWRPGRMVESREFARAGHAAEYLNALAGKRVQAYVY